MCGIVGYAGKDQAISKTINCLEKLEYRGYDSAGLAYIQNNNVVLKKKKGRIHELKKELDYNIICNTAIAHTRWATHGYANDINAHPHQVGKITLVHNGIIENYDELKEMLKEKNYSFVSSTDTEVVAALIDYLYQANNNLLDVLTSLKDYLKGSYALAIICDDDKNSIWAIKKDSPLILGIGTNEYFIASDIPAFLDYTNKYIILDDNEIVKLDGHGYSIIHGGNTITKEIKNYQSINTDSGKGNYPYYMLKEINEQPIIIDKLLRHYLSDNLSSLIDLSIYKQIDIVGCGSAYHAALIAKSLFEEYSDTKVNCYIASEYRYQKNFYDRDSIVIFISQSGETADTLACVRNVKERHIKTLAIVNVEDSSIARESDDVIYTVCGSEIAVATTKAYTAQVTILALLALKVALVKKMASLDEIKKDVAQIKADMESLIDNIDYEIISKKLYQQHDIFYIGRLIDYAIALEGSLKLKEISYINSATYPAGELKHGTISLVSKNSPIIAIITYDKTKDKTLSNIEEVKAREAYTIVLTNEDIKSERIDELIKIPKVNKWLQPIITIIPLQLIAYHVALLKGYDIDKPRNLAKSVTVE